MDNSAVKEFPGWLKQQIDLREMTQAEFAERGGITPSQVSHVLRGLRGYGDDFLKATAQALSMPVVEVYRVAGVIPPEGGRFPYTDQEMRLVHLLRELTPLQRAQVVEFAEFLKTRRER